MEKNTIKENKPEIVALIPRGDLNRISIVHAEYFDVLLENGKLGNLQITPDRKMVDNMQKSIVYTLEKLEDYKKELLNAQKLLENIECIESYEALAQELKEKTSLPFKIKTENKI